jgi:hypothetical protein
MILLIINPMSALWFIIFILVLQQFDGNYLGPRILGDSTGLPPIWVLVAIIVGGGLFGIAGMIAGVPTIAVLHTLIHELVDKRLKAGGFDSDAKHTGDGNGGAIDSGDGGVDAGGAKISGENPAACVPDESSLAAGPPSGINREAETPTEGSRADGSPAGGKPDGGRDERM